MGNGVVLVGCPFLFEKDQEETQSDDDADANRSSVSQSETGDVGGDGQNAEQTIMIIIIIY